MDQYILGLSPSNLIKVIRKNKIHQKNGERERERERERENSIFSLEKYGLDKRNDIKFIRNKIGRKKVKT